MNIEELESRIAHTLHDPLSHILQDFSHTHCQVRVSLLDAKRRKKRSNAAASNWSPDSGLIEIRFEPASEAHKQESPTVRPEEESASDTRPQKLSGAVSGSQVCVHPAEIDLLRALDRAESRPGWSFVPLKKFRDEILPSEHFPSMRTDVEQRSALRSVIEKRLVLVGKVPNPKSPQFPVTTIRLNRLMLEARAALGQGGSADLEFHPVEIPGEPLSTTVLRERR